MYFSANCRLRMLFLVPVMRPKLPPLETFVFGLPQLGWFGKLKASNRNCTLCCSEILKSFEQREVPLDDTRAGERVAAHVAMCSRSLHAEGRGIKEPNGVLFTPAQNGVGAVRVRAVKERARVGRIEAVRHRNRETGLQSDDRPDLPATHDRVQHAVLDVVRAAPAKGYLPEFAEVTKRCWLSWLERARSQARQ